ncbi:hypothetical protein RUM44_013949 [Polyplax serrata]|uniref:DUF5577 domain-containing protein n=1 Tax=Polyplax serrata TaxID=468196 RepID=A0ABR1BFN3_POLSC
MATGYTREWIKFFIGCGIPNDVATAYALIFYENRIQKNMLLDLNKEYLKDMGITVMGDVIAILRYAKVIHKKYVTEQILPENQNLPVVQKNEVPIPKKSTVKRVLETHCRNSCALQHESPEDVQVTVPNNKNSIISPNTESKLPLKTKILSTPKFDIKLDTSEISEKGLEVPVPKVRRVLPENEGGYKIKMPSGITERSKKILEQVKKREMKTVFDRLGESSVSSTTSDTSLGYSSLSNSSTTSPSTIKEKNTSVFSRLGEKTSDVSSTSPCDTSNIRCSDELPYTGILKSGTSLKKQISRSTMRADNEEKKGTVSKVDSMKGVPVKRRLGLSDDEESGQKGIYKVKRVGTNSKMASDQVQSLKSRLTSKTYENLQAKSNTSQAPTLGKGLKRRLDADTTTGITQGNNSKRVSFGSTTTRLIPPSTSATETQSGLKKYPKLTMTINNRSKGKINPLSRPIGKTAAGNAKRKIIDRLGSNRVPVKRSNEVLSMNSTGKKMCSILDRLG